jgi:hypothetical protein
MEEYHLPEDEGIRQRYLQMKIIIIVILTIALSACSHTNNTVKQELSERINMYQEMASKAYSAGDFKEYRYWRGVADGVAVSRDIMEAQ